MNMKKKVNNMTNFRRVLLMVIMFFFCIINMNAQELLTVEEAIKIALENNYEIKISKNNLKIDQSNISIGNAGILPAG